MTDIVPFVFEGSEICTIHKNGEPWFVTNDVCKALRLSNPRKAIESLDDDEKGVTLSDTVGGRQEMNIINESGLYVLILRSRNAVKPGTLQHRFRKWVTSDVLPIIRKTGRYGLRASTSRLTDTTSDKYTVLEVILRPDGVWGQVWAVPVYMLDGTEYWNIPILLQVCCGTSVIPEHLNAGQYAYDLMEEHPALTGAGPLWVATLENCKHIIQSVSGCYNQRARQILADLAKASPAGRQSSGNVVHLGDVSRQ
ncbi:BRO family protein [Thalassospira sp. MCCC 1A01428]|uniref:BRO-N domain-containing protein n=1 Tax=Thalassospira sp. MCCC 1A01428 TaxID=1470575 RepID=UPI000A1FBC26|nr:BRO family protein [Thalassospira sp. MCCC 1A01428]